MSIFKRTIFSIFLIFSLSIDGIQAAPVMRPADKFRIKEAITIAGLYGEKIWKGINAIPFAVILVTDTIEFLMHHPHPSPDFLLSEQDTILHTTIYYRKRQYGKYLLATFPAVNGLNCIVAGTPENTGRSSTDWVITLLHEHFHQYTYSYAGYFQSVENLGLSGGDQTGMWMLDYPFPYDSLPVIEQYKKYTQALSAVVTGLDTKAYKQLFNKYKKERKKLKQLLKPADYRYLSFQVWQEGIARYTEYKFLEQLNNYIPSKEVAALPDFISFNKYKQQLYRSEISNLARVQLPAEKRVCFYSIGFAEGMLLDRLNPEWHSLFLKDKFYIEQYSRKLR